jgi:hypothetical protein
MEDFVAKEKEHHEKTKEKQQTTMNLLNPYLPISLAEITFGFTVCGCECHEMEILNIFSPNFGKNYDEKNIFDLFKSECKEAECPKGCFLCLSCNKKKMIECPTCLKKLNLCNDTDHSFLCKNSYNYSHSKHYLCSDPICTKICTNCKKPICAECNNYRKCKHCNNQICGQCEQMYCYCASCYQTCFTCAGRLKCSGCFKKICKECILYSCIYCQEKVCQGCITICKSLFCKGKSKEMQEKDKLFPTSKVIRRYSNIAKCDDYLKCQKQQEIKEYSNGKCQDCNGWACPSCIKPCKGCNKPMCQECQKHELCRICVLPTNSYTKLKYKFGKKEEQDQIKFKLVHEKEIIKQKGIKTRSQKNKGEEFYALPSQRRMKQARRRKKNI